MWCAGHLACLSKIKPNRVSVTSMQSTWAVFFPLQSSRTHTLAHTRARAYTHARTHTHSLSHTQRQAGRLNTVAGNCRGSLYSERDRRAGGREEGAGRREGGRREGRESRRAGASEREGGWERGREGGRGELDGFRHHCLFLKKQFVERSFPVRTVD